MIPESDGRHSDFMVLASLSGLGWREESLNGCGAYLSLVVVGCGHKAEQRVLKCREDSFCYSSIWDLVRSFRVTI